MAKIQKKRRGAQVAAPASENGNGGAPDPIIGGELGSVETDPGENDVGQAIDWVRRALQPFEPEMRKRILRAANVMMK